MSNSIGTVLVGSSLREPSDEVVRNALAVARAAGAKLHLAHAFALPVDYAGGMLGGGWNLPEVIERMEQDLNDALAAQIERVGIDDAMIAGSTLEFGTPSDVLHELAEKGQADLIVVGAHEAGPRLARWLGSTADRVVSSAPCPVLVTRGALPVPPARVLAPVDLSPLSAGAFQCGLDLLGPLVDEVGTTQLEVLFALEPMQRRVGGQFTPEQIDRFAASELDHFVTEAGPYGALDVRAEVETGRARDVILEEAESWSADLVVLGTHGRGGLDRMLIGSVASDVTREAPCSVLVVPPPAADRAALEAAERKRAGSPDWQYISDEDPSADDG